MAMAGDDPERTRARREVERNVRRTVGFKVLRETSEWARDVEREQRQRPRLLLRLLLLVLLAACVAGALVYLYYRGP